MDKQENMTPLTGARQLIVEALDIHEQSPRLQPDYRDRLERLGKIVAAVQFTDPELSMHIRGKTLAEIMFTADQRGHTFEQTFAEYVELHSRVVKPFDPFSL